MGSWPVGCKAIKDLLVTGWFKVSGATNAMNERYTGDHGWRMRNRVPSSYLSFKWKVACRECGVKSQDLGCVILLRSTYYTCHGAMIWR